jgi:DNA-binding CsgD family transcriptional regulator
LTAREVEILRLVAKEFSSRQIAEILFISERTVETHRKNILKKTGASGSVK